MGYGSHWFPQHILRKIHVEFIGIFWLLSLFHKWVYTKLHRPSLGTYQWYGWSLLQPSSRDRTKALFDEDCLSQIFFFLGWFSTWPMAPFLKANYYGNIQINFWKKLCAICFERKIISLWITVEIYTLSIWKFWVILVKYLSLV